MIAAAGAGASPIPFNSLTAQNLAAAIKFCLTPTAAQAAQGISEKMATEDGVKTAVASFHRHLPVLSIPCDILPDQPAVWTYKTPNGVVKLSKLAAELLIQTGRINTKKLGMNETKPIHIEHRRWDPITGGTSAAIGAVFDSSTALGAAFSPTGGMDFDEGTPAELRAKNFGKAGTSIVKGAVIDMPMALADGLRHAPRMYGDKGRDYGPITDWKSGMTMAGKVCGAVSKVMYPYDTDRKSGICAGHLRRS